MRDGNGFGSAFLQPTGRSSACIKVASTGGGDITVTGSNIHDNAWIGVWCDFGEDGPFIVENSTIVRNGKAGVSYEASGGLNAVDQAIVRNNTIQVNGDADNPNRISNVIPTAITCNSCAEFTIENNIFGGNVNVIHLVNAPSRAVGDIYGVVIRNNTLNGDAVNCSFVGVTCSGNA